jgi:hypothetical protein
MMVEKTNVKYSLSNTKNTVVLFVICDRFLTIKQLAFVGQGMIC